MTIEEARKLKWGTVLNPTKSQRSEFRRRYLRKGIFLGVTKNGDTIKVVSFGTKTAESWSPKFWKPENKVVGQ